MESVTSFFDRQPYPATLDRLERIANFSRTATENVAPYDAQTNDAVFLIVHPDNGANVCAVCQVVGTGTRASGSKRTFEFRSIVDPSLVVQFYVHAHVNGSRRRLLLDMKLKKDHPLWWMTKPSMVSRSRCYRVDELLRESHRFRIANLKSKRRELLEVGLVGRYRWCGGGNLPMSIERMHAGLDSLRAAYEALRVADGVNTLKAAHFAPKRTRLDDHGGWAIDLQRLVAIYHADNNTEGHNVRSQLDCMMDDIVELEKELHELERAYEDCTAKVDAVDAELRGILHPRPATKHAIVRAVWDLVPEDKRTWETSMIFVQAEHSFRQYVEPRALEWAALIPGSERHTRWLTSRASHLREQGWTGSILL